MAESQPLTLQIDFSWANFQNRISQKTSTSLIPLYVQHFRPTNPQLRFDLAPSNTSIATAVIPGVSIASSCTIRGQKIPISPLSRLKTAYGYSSRVLSSSPDHPVTISWVANGTMKTWDFVCLDEKQLPIAKFSLNSWALKQIGTMEFGRVVSEEQRDEVVITGLTVLYVMGMRLINPLQIFGLVFASTGVKGLKEGEGEGTHVAGENGRSDGKVRRE